MTTQPKTHGASDGVELGHDEQLISATQLRQAIGGISPATEYRWRKAGILPAPIKINGYNFYRRSVMEALIERFEVDVATGATS